MSNYSKGPWKRNGALILDADDLAVAAMCSTDINAALIVASLDLLKVAEIASALRDKDWEEGNTQQLHDRIDYLVGEADAAIEKAGEKK